MSWNCDLTLDEALADPMIGAALKADRVDPRQFETLLRSTARRLAAPRRIPTPALRGGPLLAAAPHRFAGEDRVLCRRPAAEGCRAW